jgi:hypothetical protein
MLKVKEHSEESKWSSVLKTKCHNPFNCSSFKGKDKIVPAFNGALHHEDIN